MIVAFEKGLDDLKNGLSLLGYSVVDYIDYAHPVDAIVYKSIYLEPCSDSNFVNSKNQNGILMICAKNKSINDIDNILKQRTYSPLF